MLSPLSYKGRVSLGRIEPPRLLDISEVPSPAWPQRLRADGRPLNHGQLGLVMCGADGARTRDLCLDKAVLSQLSYGTMRTRDRSRTCNPPGLSRRPLPVGLPGHSGQPRYHTCASAGCKASPTRASGEDRTRSPALRMRCTTNRAALASGAGGGTRTHTLPGYRPGTPTLGASSTLRALGGIRTRTVQPLELTPLRIGLREGEPRMHPAPGRGFEPRSPDPESGVLPIGLSGNGPGWPAALRSPPATPSAPGRCRPRRDDRPPPQSQTRLGGGAVSFGAVAAAARGHRVGPGVAATRRRGMTRSTCPPRHRSNYTSAGHEPGRRASTDRSRWCTATG